MINRDSLKHVAAIATAIAAIVTSLVALLREPQEPKARSSYETLAKKVEELQGAQKQQHDDTVAMRGYLEGYLKSLRENQQTLAETPAPVPSLRPITRPHVDGDGIPDKPRPALKPLPPPTLPKPAERQPMSAPPDFGKL